MSVPADRAVLSEVARWRAGFGSADDVTACALSWAWGDEARARVLMERAVRAYTSNPRRGQ